MSEEKICSKFVEREFKHDYTLFFALSWIAFLITIIVFLFNTKMFPFFLIPLVLCIVFAILQLNSKNCTPMEVIFYNGSSSELSKSEYEILKENNNSCIAKHTYVKK